MTQPVTLYVLPPLILLPIISIGNHSSHTSKTYNLPQIETGTERRNSQAKMIVLSVHLLCAEDYLSITGTKQFLFLARSRLT